MSGGDVLNRLTAFPAPACRCAGGAEGRHDGNCLSGLLVESASEIQRLRAENGRLSAMAAVGGPVGARAGERGVWVRLMCYFGANGVWNSEDETADVLSLDLSDRLKAELLAWKHSLDAVDTVTPAHVEAYQARALNLGRRVKEERPNWKVVYVDRTKSGADIRNKDYFEHEVSL